MQQGKVADPTGLHRMMAVLRRLALALALAALAGLPGTAAAEDAVFQFMHRGEFEYAEDDVVKSAAYLWIPERCERLRGLLVMGQNITEHGIAAHPAIRQVCADHDLGIVWFTPRFLSVKTLDDSDKAVAFLQQLLDGLAETSGYGEVATAPWLPIGQSMHLRMVYHLLNAAPRRCLAAICVKNALSLTLCRNRETPVLVAVGTAQEWFQNEADIRTKWQDLSFYETFARERAKHPAWPVSLLAEGSSGHFDCTGAMMSHFAAYIAAVAAARLPEDPSEPPRAVELEKGFVAGLPLPDRDAFDPIRHAEAPSARKAMPWYFDEALARDAIRIATMDWSAKSQLPVFLDEDGGVVPLAYQGVAKPVPIHPGEDGVTFALQGALLPALPAGFVGAGEPLATAPGDPVAEWICGPVRALGGGRFRIALDRTWPHCPAVVALRQLGAEGVRAAVQPGYLDLSPNREGAEQSIAFAALADVRHGTTTVPLEAAANSGLPVRFFVAAGPATVEGSTLTLREIPPRSRFPVEVVVTAWQWGRSVAPRVKSAELVTRRFRVLAPEKKEEATLRLDLQRPVDSRLAKIEALGLEGSGLFRGERHLVRDAGELRATSGKLKPGDQLVLAAGEWKDARFTWEGRGTAGAPILIRPEKPGGVVFSGESALRVHGEHLVVHDFIFREVRPQRGGDTVLAAGNGAGRPADGCVFNRLRFEHCGSARAEDWPRVSQWLMNLRGKDITVANCDFDGMKNIGQMIGAAELPPDAPQRLHVLDSRFRNRPKIDDQNGYEIIQIGWSGARAAPTGSLIAGNVFENCDGENELITLKGSDVVVRDNRFLGCQGVLCLRTASRVLVHRNLFDSLGRESTGGVRLQGEGHVLTENVFRSLVKPKNHYYWPVSIMAADNETYGTGENLSGYGRAKDILIARNRFERCERRIAVGIYPRPEYPLLPRKIRAVGNVFVGGGEGSVFDYLAPDPEGVLAGEVRESGNLFQRR